MSSDKWYHWRFTSLPIRILPIRFLPWRLTLGMLLLVTSAASHGNTWLNDIEVSPRSCHIQDPSTSCQEQVKIQWRLATPKQFCVLTQSGLSVYCSDESKTGETTVPGLLAKSTTLTLVDTSDQTKTRKIKIFVVKSTNQRKAYQHPWSIF